MYKKYKYYKANNSNFFYFCIKTIKLHIFVYKYIKILHTSDLNTINKTAAIHHNNRCFPYKI